TGLMLTIAGVGGFAVSAVFGLIASNGFTPAWIFGGVVGIVFALFGLLAREPLGVTARVGKVAEVASAEQPITG
ncbi:MAG TPA: hypothetical protein VKT25_03630, partial [Ktedonobacteraceae bacterium]|nr:hypothetical protein [Ktedonobacteraceae bacterium]